MQAPDKSNPQKMAQYLRGKVNLGKMSGAKGNNGRAARPVERAVELGLLKENFDGIAYLYNTSHFGEQVLEQYEEMK